MVEADNFGPETVAMADNAREIGTDASRPNYWPIQREGSVTFATSTPITRFALVLSAHVLFLYDDGCPTSVTSKPSTSYAELAGQLRVFPLHGVDADQSDVVAELGERLQSEGYTTDVREVLFEFQRGASKMLVVEYVTKRSFGDDGISHRLKCPLSSC